MLVVAVNSVAAVVVVRPPSVVIASVIRRPTVVAVIAARVITGVAWVTIIPVPVRRVTEPHPDSSDSDRNLGVSLFCRNQTDCYQW